MVGSLSFISHYPYKSDPARVSDFGTGVRQGHYTLTVLKFQGTETGISKSEISSHGKVLRVDNDNKVSGPNGVAGKSTQYWDKK